MVAKLSDRVGGEEFPRPIVVGENLLYNGNFKVNQTAFAGGQPAAGVYGFDGWLGSPDGLQIQQIVENDNALTGDYAISWEGGTGTASVNGTAGLASGDIVQLTTSTNFSVIVPTDATKIKFEQFGVTPYQEPKIAEQLVVCQRYLEKGESSLLITSTAASQWVYTLNQFKVAKASIPAITTVINSVANLFNQADVYPTTSNYRRQAQSTGATNICEERTFWTADARLYP